MLPFKVVLPVPVIARLAKGVFAPTVLPNVTVPVPLMISKGPDPSTAALKVMFWLLVVIIGSSGIVMMPL